MDKNLTWKEHIHYLNIKLNRALGIISKLRYNVPQNLLLTIYSAFFKPHIEYLLTSGHIQVIQTYNLLILV